MILSYLPFFLKRYRPQKTLQTYIGCSCYTTWVHKPANLSLSTPIISITLKHPLCFGTWYGSEPSESSAMGVAPWQTTSTRKWSISSAVTLYGAPITTSCTYCKQNNIFIPYIFLILFFVAQHLITNATVVYSISPRENELSSFLCSSNKTQRGVEFCLSPRNVSKFKRKVRNWLTSHYHPLAISIFMWWSLNIKKEPKIILIVNEPCKQVPRVHARGDSWWGSWNLYSGSLRDPCEDPLLKSPLASVPLRGNPSDQHGRDQTHLLHRLPETN